LNGDDECAEIGYISIEELTRHGVELDLHFTPCSLGNIKAERAGNNWVQTREDASEVDILVTDFLSACNKLTSNVMEQQNKSYF
jgi:hypothetical protein